MVHNFLSLFTDARSVSKVVEFETDTNTHQLYACHHPKTNSFHQTKRKPTLLQHKYNSSTQLHNISCISPLISDVHPYLSNQLFYTLSHHWGEIKSLFISHFPSVPLFWTLWNVTHSLWRSFKPQRSWDEGSRLQITWSTFNSMRPLKTPINWQLAVVHMFSSILCLLPYHFQLHPSNVFADILA